MPPLRVLWQQPWGGVRAKRAFSIQGVQDNVQLYSPDFGKQFNSMLLIVVTLCAGKRSIETCPKQSQARGDLTDNMENRNVQFPWNCKIEHNYWLVNQTKGYKRHGILKVAGWTDHEEPEWGSWHLCDKKHQCRPWKSKARSSQHWELSVGTTSRDPFGTVKMFQEEQRLGDWF